MTKRTDISHVAFYFDEWLTGTFELEEGERGTFITLCALIWKTGNRLKDEPQSIARWCNISVRLWNKRKARLIELGKIAVEDGFIVQPRAVSEYEKARGKREPLVKAGRKGGLKRAENAAKIARNAHENQDNPLDNNDSGSSYNQIQNQKKETSEAKASSSKKAKRPVAMPDDWQPDERFEPYARSKGWSRERISVELEKFYAHYSDGGRKCLDATFFKAWVRWVNNSYGPPGNRRRTWGEQQQHDVNRLLDDLIGDEHVPQRGSPPELDSQAFDRPALTLVHGSG